MCGVRVPDVAPGDAPFGKLREIFEHGGVEHGPSQVAGPMPVVSSDPSRTPPLLAPIQAFRWFVEFGGRFGSRWENSIPWPRRYLFAARPKVCAGVRRRVWRELSHWYERRAAALGESGGSTGAVVVVQRFVAGHAGLRRRRRVR